jgi:hypothetical protein
VAVIQNAASKSDALSQCQAINPASNLMMPKSSFTQLKMEQLAERMNISNITVFLGMSKADGGQWLWDDGTPVFVKCEIFSVSIFDDCFPRVIGEKHD